MYIDERILTCTYRVLCTLYKHINKTHIWFFHVPIFILFSGFGVAVVFGSFSTSTHDVEQHLAVSFALLFNMV